MKRNLALFTAIIASLFILTGCSSKTAVPAADGQNSQASQNPQASQGGGGRGRMPDYGQPSRPADIRGIVKSIIGNQATILKLAAPVGGGRRASSTQDNASSTGSNPVTLSLGGTGSAARGTGGGFAGGPGGFAGGGRQGGQGGQGGTTDRAAMLAEMEKMSTGEDQIVIPVGIKMLKSSVNADTKKREMVEATLSDVVADKFITIWLNTSVTDKKVAEFILIN